MKSNTKKIELETGHLYKGSHTAKNTIKKAIEMSYTQRSKNRDKKDFATIQQVFDKKTLKNLNSLYINEIIQKIHSDIISTGKEANVYYTKSLSSKELAVKIYKTMVTNFKDREEYISGEFRFRKRSKNTRTNPHKLIKVWAEKEFRNLKRIQQVGIKCPEPIVIKENILVMEFIGENGVAAKRLKDVCLEGKHVPEAYLKVLKMMRVLFVKARLVHGDLSEFNLLVWEGEIVMIDVSQSIEDNHPMAIEFLKRDIYNMNYYFGNLGVLVFKLRDVFRFITDFKLKEEDVEPFIADMILNANEKGDESEEKKEIELFMGINIPRTLFELNMKDLDRILELEKRKRNVLNEEKPIFSNLVGLTEGIQEVSGDEGSEEDSEEDEESFEKIKRVKVVVDKEKLKREKKLAKKEFKLEKREKRKNKMPKKVKRRMLKKKEKKK